MKRATVLQIPREGWLILLPLIVLLIVAQAVIGWWAAVPIVVLLCAGVLFFHDRPCHVAAEPLSVMAPADGRVTVCEPCHDPLLGREAIRIGIRVDRLGGYYLRSPIEGTVREPPTGASVTMRRRASWLRGDSGEDVVLTVGHGSLLGMRPYGGNYGDRVGQGRCCGVRRLVSRLDVYLPIHARILVRNGDRVTGGMDRLARLARTDDGQWP